MYSARKGSQHPKLPKKKKMRTFNCATYIQQASSIFPFLSLSIRTSYPLSPLIVRMKLYTWHNSRDIYKAHLYSRSNTSPEKKASSSIITGTEHEHINKHQVHKNCSEEGKTPHFPHETGQPSQGNAHLANQPDGRVLRSATNSPARSSGTARWFTMATRASPATSGHVRRFKGLFQSPKATTEKRIKVGTPYVRQSGRAEGQDLNKRGLHDSIFVICVRVLGKR